MTKFKRICVLVLDGFGVGELEDAEQFGDQGANTLGHVLKAKPKLHIPHLESLGLLKLSDLSTKNSTPSLGYFGRMKEISAGKDTTTGHWEMMGLPVQKPFQTFPTGFPKEIIDEFIRQNNLPGFLGNYPASGTDIIEDLGLEHLQTGRPIVYTSADSVFQIAVHEKEFGLDRLYSVCEKTRQLLNDSDYLVGRVIARPFLGQKPGDFQRTPNRKDFSIEPFAETVLTRLKTEKKSVIGIGKIPSIYNYQGISESVNSKSDDEGIRQTCEILDNRPDADFIFSNLNDLDMLFGHRRNINGYASQLERIDQALPEIFRRLKQDDLLLITSDHGNDPSFKGSDHTREFVPLLAYSPRFQASGEENRNLGTCSSFCDVGQSILHNFGLSKMSYGNSFLQKLTG